MTELMISGGLGVAYFIAAMFFMKFWSTTRDRLFGFFAAAFAILALQRLLLPFIPPDMSSALYVVRVIAFLLIIVAIVDKNRASR